MLKKSILFLLLFCMYIYADDFEQYKAKQNKEFEESKKGFIQWKQNEQKEFQAYKKAQREAFDEYKKEITNYWPKAQTSTNKKWVEYNKDYTSRKSVDFKNKQINLEVIAKNKKEAKKKIEELYMQLLKDDVKSAYENDKLNSKIAQKLKKPKQIIKSKDKIITDILSLDDMKTMYSDMKKQKLQMVKYKNRYIYKANIKMPPNAMIKKAKTYKNQVNKYSKIQKIPPELIYAIMHSESSFNPMARSHIPAFGLMQIVPRTAGIDSYRFLFGKKRVPSSSYLYNSEKNIMMGSAYLHILYYKYLKKIKNPISKLFCAIAAYNTGAGNVAKAFIGNSNINKAALKINSMNPNDVYTYLIKNLPYSETKHYLKKVSNRTSSYYNLIQKNQL